MKINLYAVYDKVSQQYNTPFGAPNDTHAVRSFRMEVNRPHDNNAIYHNPKDFTLYKVANFDHDTGCVNTAGENGREFFLQTPELIIEAHKLINDKETTNG